jgi:hypothetical protein
VAVLQRTISGARRKNRIILKRMVNADQPIRLAEVDQSIPWFCGEFDAYHSSLEMASDVLRQELPRPRIRSRLDIDGP